MKIVISALYQRLPNFFLKESCSKYLMFCGLQTSYNYSSLQIQYKSSSRQFVKQTRTAFSNEWALISYNCHFEIFSQLKMWKTFLVAQHTKAAFDFWVANTCFLSLPNLSTQQKLKILPIQNALEFLCFQNGVEVPNRREA